MSRFIESIGVLHGEIRNLAFHQKRMNETYWTFFGKENSMDLNEILNDSSFPLYGKFKCRIVYAEEVLDIQFMPYEIRPLDSFALVENNALDYRWKYDNRQVFERMKKDVNENEIIIVQNGEITDTSYSNLVFFDGENWVTPTTYLLNGTMRQSLLESKQIIEKPIQVEDLHRFVSFKMINAMMNLEESPNLSMSLIHG